MTKRPSSLLMLTVRSDIGGGPKHLFYLCRSLLQDNPNLKIFIGAPNEEPFGPLFQEMAHLFVPIPRQRFSLKSFFQLLMLCRRHSISIVHSHGWGAGLYGRLLAFFGMRSIHTFHGVHAGRRCKDRVKIKVDQVLKLLTHDFICVSHSEKKEALQHEVAFEECLSVIYNGVDIQGIRAEFSSISQKEARQKYQLPLDKKIWGTLARLDYQKGLDLFLKAIYEFPTDVFFALAGDGKEYKNLKLLIENYRLQGRVVLLGEVKKPMTFLKCLDGYFSFSRGEALPLGVLEAITCTLPCLLSKVPGHNDFIELGMAQSFSLLRLESFQEKLDKANSENLSEEMKEKILELVRQKFGLDEMTKKVEKIYFK